MYTKTSTKNKILAKSTVKLSLKGALKRFATSTAV